MKSHLLLTGAQGAGKSTAMRRLAELLGAAPGGFYTEEMRAAGERRGFRLVAFNGWEAVIAHVEFPKTQRVGKYGVDLAAIDEASENTLVPSPGVDIYVVDEIGKMECLSERFVARMRALLDSKLTVVATVASRGGGFIAEAKRREDCELWSLTRGNRDAIPGRILRWIRDKK